MTSRFLNLDEIARWALNCSYIWSELAIESNVIGPTIGRAKNDLAIELITANRLVGIAIWDSGEYEVIDMVVESSDDPAVFVGTLTTRADAKRVIRSLIADLAAVSG